MLRLAAWSALAIVLFLFCFPAKAGMVARDDRGNLARLKEAPCSKSYEACWTRIGSVILVIDEAGDLSPIPINAFEKEQQI